MWEGKSWPNLSLETQSRPAQLVGFAQLQLRVNAMSTLLSRNPSMLAAAPVVAALLGDAIMLAYGWRDRIRQRYALARLDDRMLHDIGLSRADVDGEVSKPFWHA